VSGDLDDILRMREPFDGGHHVGAAVELFKFGCIAELAQFRHQDFTRALAACFGAALF
jgi:hypothetical protein